MNAGDFLFLSYRSIEADFALRLAADLKNAGVRLWMDRLDAGIKVGDDWVQALQDALDGCAALIAVLSPEYVHSKYCRRELQRADTLGRPIFPVLLQAVTTQDWPLEIQEKQYIDFQGWHDDIVYCKRLNEPVQVLRQRSPKQFGIPPDRETRYLVNLISELEASKGVLQYVEPLAEAEVSEAERPGRQQDHGWAPEFALLLDLKTTSKPPDVNTTRRIPLAGIQEAVERYPRHVLIGPPGTGKTTTIRKLALDAARERLANPTTAPLPLLLYLSAWSDEASPADFIRAHWPFEADPSPLLSQGDVLLYLDGMNEMGAKGAGRAKHLRDWQESESFPARVVVTCRLEDYTQELSLNLPTILVQEMDRAHIERLAVNYLGKRQAEAFLSRIFRESQWAGEESRSLAALASNPYFLSALIYIFQYAPGGELPSNPGQLFRSLVRALWEREARHRTRGWVPFEEMERAFSRLALAMVDGELPTEVPLDYAMERVGGQELLYAGQRANLVEKRDGHVRFYHQLMQDYFAAVALLTDPRDKGELIKKPKWHHTFVAWSGLVPDAYRVLDELVSEETGELGPWVFIASGFVVPDQLKECYYCIQDLGAYSHYDFEPAFAGLSKVGSAAVPVLLKLARGNPDPLVRMRAIYVLGCIKDAAAVPDLIACLSDDSTHPQWNGRVSDWAAEALRKIGTPEAINAIEQRTQGSAG